MPEKFWNHKVEKQLLWNRSKRSKMGVSCRLLNTVQYKLVLRVRVHIWLAQSSESLDRKASSRGLLRRDGGNLLWQHSDANVTQLVFDRLFREKGRERGDIICRFVIMHQQAVLLPVKWDQVNGGVSRSWGRRNGEKKQREGAVFKDAAAMGKLPPAHGIDAVHLAQWEMTADYSAIPLSTSVLPHVLHSSQKHDLSIHRGRREGNGESDGYRRSEQERQ